MTRSSWYCFWEILTGFGAFLTLVFAVLAVSVLHPVAASTGSALADLSEAAWQRLGRDIAVLLALFWGNVTIFAGLAWWACAMALAERRAFKIQEQARLDAKFNYLQGHLVDAKLRD